jgi:protein-S-isoprenylcysteine O-methyltransferase Ste14
VRAKRKQLGLADQTLIVAIAAAFAYQAHVAVTLHRRGFERWEIAVTLGTTAVVYLLASWAAIALLRRWRKATKESAVK